MERTEATVLDHGCLFDNPLSHVCSRHGYFPGMTVLPDGELLAIFMLGEAFEAPNLRPHVTRSTDQGHTWTDPEPIGEAAVNGVPVNDAVKPLALTDVDVVAAGYRMYRDHPMVGIGNPETDGVERSATVVVRSSDRGQSWTSAAELDLGLSSGLENSGPPVLLSDGSIICGGPPMPLWDGTKPDGVDGRLIRSTDGGRTWTAHGVYFAVANRLITPYESRLCELGPGR
ncbi:MAG: exo-alpha-sialidase, partial [Lentisphaerae bacterium]|nr:exo-alpha-sialidase [Lentisphaerota bacterium]